MCAQPAYVNTYIGIPAPDRSKPPHRAAFFMGWALRGTQGRIPHLWKNHDPVSQLCRCGAPAPHGCRVRWPACGPALALFFGARGGKYTPQGRCSPFVVRECAGQFAARGARALCGARAGGAWAGCGAAPPACHAAHSRHDRARAYQPDGGRRLAAQDHAPQ